MSGRSTGFGSAEGLNRDFCHPGEAWEKGKFPLGGLGGGWNWGSTEGPRLGQGTINIQPMYRLYSERKLPIIFGDTLLVRNSLFFTLLCLSAFFR